MQKLPYLYLAISMDHDCLFNPTKQETFMGALMEASSEQKAVNRVAKK